MIGSRSNYHSTRTIRKLQTGELFDLANQLNQVHADLVATAHEANLYADDANKPRIKIIE